MYSRLLGHVVQSLGDLDMSLMSWIYWNWTAFVVTHSILCAVPCSKCIVQRNTCIYSWMSSCFVWHLQTFLLRWCCRLLQPSHAGPEDWPGGSWGAGEGQSSRSGTAHGPVSRHMVTGGVAVVYLPLRWRPPDRGEEKPRLSSRDSDKTIVLHVSVWFLCRQSWGSGIVCFMKAPKSFSAWPWPSSFTTSHRFWELALCSTCTSASNKWPVERSLWTVTASSRWDKILQRSRRQRLWLYLLCLFPPN